MNKTLILIPILSFCFLVQSCSRKRGNDIYYPNQTSASLLIKYAENQKLKAEPSQKDATERKYLLTYDIFIKARSYAIST